jgi:hypothetical protein
MHVTAVHPFTTGMCFQIGSEVLPQSTMDAGSEQGSTTGHGGMLAMGGPVVVVYIACLSASDYQNT